MTNHTKENGLSPSEKVSLWEATGLMQEEVRESTQRLLNIWRQTEDGEQVFRALVFAKLTGVTISSSSWWKSVLERSQGKGPQTLLPELQVAIEMQPKGKETGFVFESTLNAVNHWRNVMGFVMRPIPHVLDSLATEEEMGRWMILQEERELKLESLPSDLPQRLRNAA